MLYFELQKNLQVPERLHMKLTNENEENNTKDDLLKIILLHTVVSRVIVELILIICVSVLINEDVALFKVVLYIFVFRSILSNPPDLEAIA
jgi:hypothetical protein